MSNSEIDKLIDRIPKENKYMVTTEEVVNYIYMLENRINKALHLITHSDITDYRVFDEELINILRGDDK